MSCTTQFLMIMTVGVNGANPNMTRPACRRALNGAPPYQRARLGIDYVPQGRDIFPQLAVEENLQIGLASRRDSLTKGKKGKGVRSCL